MEQFEELNIKRLYEILIKNISMILIVALLAGVVALAFTESFATPKYESYVTLYVNNDTGEDMGKIYGSDIQASQMLVATYSVILKSGRVLNETVDRLVAMGIYGYDAAMLAECTAAISVDATEVFKIIVRDIDPRMTQIIAATLSDVFQEVIVEYISASSAAVIDAAEYGVLVSPNLRISMILGILIGLILSCGFVILKELFDIRIKSEEQIKSLFKHPVLGVIPDIGEAQSYRSGYTYRSHKYGVYRYETKGAGDENEATEL